MSYGWWPIETVASKYVGNDGEYTYITFGDNAALADHIKYASFVRLTLTVGSSLGSDGSTDTKFRIQSLKARMTTNSTRPSAQGNSLYTNESTAATSGTITISLTKEDMTDTYFLQLLKYGIRVFNQKSGKMYAIKSASIAIMWGDECFAKYTSSSFTYPKYKNKTNSFSWAFSAGSLTISKLIFEYVDSAGSKTASLDASASSYDLAYTACTGTSPKVAIYGVYKTSYHSNIKVSIFEFAKSVYETYYSFSWAYETPTITSPTASDTSIAYGSTQKIAFSYSVAGSFVDTIQCQMWDKNGSTTAKYASTTGSVSGGIQVPTAEYTATTDGMRARVVTTYLDGKKVYSAWVNYTFTYETPSTSASSAYFGAAVSLAWTSPTYTAGISYTEIYQGAYSASTASTKIGTSTGTSFSYSTANYTSDKSGFCWRAVFVYKNGYTSSGSIRQVTFNYAKPTGYPANGVSLVHGATYTFNWTASATIAALSKITLTYNNYSSSGTATSVTLGTSVSTYNMDTSKVSDTSGMSWSLTYTFTNGQTTTTGTLKIPFTAPTVTVNDLRPASGNVYKGFSTTFSWAVNVSTPSNPSNVKFVSLKCAQTKAVLRWQKTNDTTNHDFSISGATKTKAVDDTVMTDSGSVYTGGFRWCVVVTTTMGHTYTSSWQTLTYVEVPISIGNALPATGSRAIKIETNQFSWTFAADTSYSPPQPITQKSATLYWRPTDGDWQSISITTAQTSYTFPANYFTADEIEWYVEATANTGTTATSEVQTITTLDDISYPACISPAGEFVDASSKITFTWEHIISTGTKPTECSIYVSTDAGASYTFVGMTSSNRRLNVAAPTKMTFSAGFFDAGIIYWRVQTANSDGTYGEYSDPAIFVAERNPDAPKITYTSESLPLPVISWQADDQVGYEVAIDGVTVGSYYGTEKTWQSTQLLEDGEHTVAIRVSDKHGKVSAWTSTKLVIENSYDAESEIVSATATEQFGQVQFDFALTGEYSKIYLLRDGDLIAKADPGDGTMIDRCSVGSHTYTVRAVKTDGFYVDSDLIVAAPRVPFGCIGLADGTGWQLLKLTSGKDFVSRSMVVSAGSFLQYSGRKAPVYDSGDEEGRTETLTAEYIVATADIPALMALLGQEVVYKDFHGNLIKGVFTSLPQSQRGQRTTVSISITGTDTEAVEYEPV